MSFAYDIAVKDAQTPPPLPDTGKGGPDTGLIDLFERLTKATARERDEVAALKQCLAAVCAYTGWPVGHLYVLTADFQLVSPALWHVAAAVDGPGIADFRRRSESTRFAPGEGLVGRVFAEKAAMSIADVGREAGFVRGMAAKAAGVHGYLAFPVMVGESAVAVMEFLSLEEAVLDPLLVRLMGFVGEQAGRIIERQRHDRHMADLRKQFEADVGAVVQAVAAASEELSATAKSLNLLVAEAGRMGADAGMAAGAVHDNMDTLKCGTQALLDQASEIGERAERSASSARTAEAAARETIGQLTVLTGAVERVGQAVAMVRAITRQTKMLSLNATIEAVRAGVHGQGFAVVAGEVKNLASETDGVTNMIEALVGDMRGASDSSAAAIDRMGLVIRELDRLAHDVSAAASGQMLTSRDMATLSDETAGRAETAAARAGDVDRALSEVAAAADEVEKAAHMLTGYGQNLSSSVVAFLGAL